MPPRSAYWRKSACAGKRCIASIVAPRIAGGTATCSPCRARCGRRRPRRSDIDRGVSLALGLILGRLLPRALRGALQHILARHPGVAGAAQRQHTADQYGGNDDEDNDDFEHVTALLRTSL